jgi:hypothetical protein
MDTKQPEGLADNAKAQCNHGQAQMNAQSSIGQEWGGLYPPCPYCQPKCPCCGRPLGNWNYPQDSYYPYGTIK